ncbi:hypothetical protein IWQ60_008555 [Tieghemiomyces parasiticus]|uniref:SprT-like domain-containing protein n=1 Tax=Tieghemiomyces parasiticus TaxID=78921 RepID=A0A9W8DR30_9FUNG|nr:hypothetical protein IWQ60_008555 [Tieghemiomyces parasiticus]
MSRPAARIEVDSDSTDEWFTAESVLSTNSATIPRRTAGSGTVSSANASPVLATGRRRRLRRVVVVSDSECESEADEGIVCASPVRCDLGKRSGLGRGGNQSSTVAKQSAQHSTEAVPPAGTLVDRLHQRLEKIVTVVLSSDDNTDTDIKEPASVDDSATGARRGKAVLNLPVWRPSPTRSPRRTATARSKPTRRRPIPPAAPLPLSPPASKAGTSVAATPAQPSRRSFIRDRTALARDLFTQFNTQIFRALLPADLSIEWSATLNKTAGRAYTGWRIKDVERQCRIELAAKVVDSVERLRETLLHELCHCAVWMIDGARESHGPVFKKWAQRAMRAFPDIPVTTRHTYAIDYKYKYQCTGSQCTAVYGRHSKSIDTSRQVCGRCKGRLHLVDRHGEAVAAKSLNAYQQFVKENYARLRAENSSLNRQQLMKLVSEQYKTRHTAPAVAALGETLASVALA